MTFPITRAQWDDESAALVRQVWGSQETESDAIESCADWLIARLYKPDAELGCCYDGDGPDGKAMAEEPINWGDLSARVERKGDVWIVTLEEAASGQCPILCEYVRSWLEAWGWTPVIVQTEW